MRVQRTTLAFLAAAICLSWTRPSLAEGQANEVSNHTFALSAMVTAKPLLSRDELDPTAVGARTMATPPNGGQIPQGQGLGLSRQFPAAAAQPQAPAATAGLQGRAAQDDAPGAYLKEYNVDWSRWVSAMADRWFYVLHSAEYQFGIQFVTQRPALIQFTCYADGTIGNIMLKQSSGVPAYDRLQIATLVEALPTPPFPAGTHRNSITLVQGWESHPRQQGEQDFQPGSFGKDFPLERVRKWCAGL